MLIDVGKIVFGGIVLTSVLKIDNLPKVLVVVFGLICTLLLAVAGIILFEKAKN